MFRKTLTLALSLLLLNAAAARSAFAVKGQGGEDAHTAKVKAKVTELGVGKSARVTVRTSDGAGVKGYVKVARENDFIVTKDDDGADVTVPYARVKNLKTNLPSKGRKAAINALGIGAAVTAIALVLWGANRY